MIKLVMIESPYSGDIIRNTRYVHYCMLDSLSRDEAPLASHVLYPPVLNEHEPKEREKGIECGLAWAFRADLNAFYIDLDWSPGMEEALEVCKERHAPYEFRHLSPALLEKFLGKNNTDEQTGFTGAER